MHPHEIWDWIADIREENYQITLPGYRMQNLKADIEYCNGGKSCVERCGSFFLPDCKLLNLHKVEFENQQIAIEFVDHLYYVGIKMRRFRTMRDDYLKLKFKRENGKVITIATEPNGKIMTNYDIIFAESYLPVRG